MVLGTRQEKLPKEYNPRLPKFCINENASPKIEIMKYTYDGEQS
jgi:hypothetical protein